MEQENVELNEKHNEVVKTCDDYVTKIESMEQKIDFLEKQIVDKEKEYSHVGVNDVRSFFRHQEFHICKAVYSSCASSVNCTACRNVETNHPGTACYNKTFIAIARHL